HAMHQVHRADEVDRDDLLPERRVALQERLEHVPAGIVDEDVDRASALDCAPDRLIVGDVDFFRTVQVEDDDLSAFVLEALDDRAPDARGAPGDDCGLALESSHAASSGMTAVASSSILPGES